MMRKTIALTLALLLLLSVMPMAVAAGVTATPTASTVLVDSAEKAFDAYTINGSNYFKLRDLAFILSGTSKQFEVQWDDAKNAINLTIGTPYTAVGSEMTAKGAGAKDAVLNTSKIYLDGAEIALTAYTIEGNNYFKLRDLASVINFGVGWDGAKNLITVTSEHDYYTKKYYLTDGRILAEFISGSFTYPAGSFWAGEFTDDYVYATADNYGYNIIDERGAVLEALNYQKVDQLSNGYFRAISGIRRDTDEYSTFNIDTYEVSDRKVVTNEYLSGTMFYLNKNAKPISDKVYDMAYDFNGTTAIATAERDSVLVAQSGDELNRVTDGVFKITTDGKYYIAKWCTYQDEYTATIYTDLNGKLLYKAEGHNGADYLGDGCFVTPAGTDELSGYSLYSVCDVETGKPLNDRVFYGVSTFGENGLLRFTVKQEGEYDAETYYRVPVMYGLMDRQGNVLIEANTFAFIGRFKDGRAVAMRGGLTGNDAGYGGADDYRVTLYPGITSPSYDPDGWSNRPMSWHDNWADTPRGGTWEWIDKEGNTLGTPTADELKAELKASGIL